MVGSDTDGTALDVADIRVFPSMVPDGIEHF